MTPSIEPGGEVWFAPVGSGHPIGRDSDGTPILGNEEGLTKMERLGTVVAFDAEAGTVTGAKHPSIDDRPWYGLDVIEEGDA